MSKKERAKNIQKAREDASALIAARPPDASPEPENGPPPGPPPQGMGFSLDELFAAYGAKDFENRLLQGRLAIAEQQITTLQNVIAKMEVERATKQ